MSIKTKIAWMLLGSVISFSLGFTCNNINNWGIGHWIMISLIFVIVIALLSILGPLRLILRSSNYHELADEWKSEWSFCKNSKRVKVYDSIELHQIGRYVYGKGLSHTVEGPVQFDIAKYKIKAEVFPDGHIEGVWINTNKGRNYRGPFLGRIHNNSSKITANWIGIGTDEIHTGTWEWKRVLHEIS